MEVFLMNEKEKEYCLEVIKKHEEKPNYLKNVSMAFLFGGLISIFGQILIVIYTNFNTNIFFLTLKVKLIEFTNP